MNEITRVDKDGNTWHYQLYRGHEISVGIYPKQDQSYYDALERRDGFAAHLLHLPYVQTQTHLLESQMRMIDLIEDHKEDQERFAKLSPEMQLLEIQMRFGVKIKPDRKLKFKYGFIPVFISI